MAGDGMNSNDRNGWRRRSAIFAAAVAACAFAGPLAAQTSGTYRLNYDAVPGEVVVTFKERGPRVDAQGTFNLMRLLDPSARVAKRLTRIGGVLIDMPSARDKAGRTHALARLRRDPAVEAAEPNFIYYLSAGMPNDPLAPQQWHLRAVKAMEAWSHAAGGREVVVAVMDTGVQLFHEDLRGRIWTNPKEIPDNGLDDDGNGFVDDIHGWNFVQGHNNPTAELVPLPQEGCLPDEASRGYEDHGTHVAGIIGATTGNGRGIAGLAPNVKIMPLKIMGGPCGIGRLVDVVLALDYAIANGAHIVNMSIGGPNRSAIMQKLLEAAGRKGILVVAAAGNAASDNDVVPEFPSGYPLPNIISVAATGVDDELADFSNFGPRSVHLAAPGVDILSSVPEGEDGRGPDSGYKAHTGTSMAVPVVVGAAALIKSQHPDMTGAQIRERLLETVDRVAGLAGKVAAGGRLNVARAVGAPMPSRIVGPPPRKPAPGKAADDRLDIGGVRVDRGRGTEDRRTLPAGNLTGKDMF